eukprot:scaffold59524_cov20-Tisochrysis_lutea.AAC.3
MSAANLWLPVHAAQCKGFRLLAKLNKSSQACWIVTNDQILNAAPSMGLWYSADHRAYALSVQKQGKESVGGANACALYQAPFLLHLSCPHRQ